MSPEDQVKEGVYEVLWNVLGRGVLGPVLVQHQQVEPLIRLLLQPQHLDPVCPEQPVEARVLHLTHPIQGQLGLALPYQKGNTIVILEGRKEGRRSISAERKFS